MLRFGLLRDSILLIIGTAGVLHQEFIREMSDPSLLLFYAAIFGLTAFLPNGIAERIRSSNEENQNE